MSVESYNASVWSQTNGWHWSITGFDVQPQSGIAGSFGGAVLEATERLAALDPALAVSSSPEDGNG